jgi:fluoride exporter
VQKYFLIALGGALGSLARFWVGSTIAGRLGTKFLTALLSSMFPPVSSSIIIGFSLAFLARCTEINPAWRFLVPVGFVGASRNFSTFEWETFSNLQTGAFLIAALYVVLSFFVGLIAVWCDVLIARIIS